MHRYPFVPLVFSASLLLAGCPGGGSGTAGLATPTVTPADGAAAQAVDPAVLVLSALFDEALDPASVGANAFTLEGPSGAVAGDVSLDGDRTVVFVPDAPLALAAQYTATVTTTLRAQSGRRLRRNFAWMFATRDGQWQGAALAETDETGAATNVRLAMGGNGHAVVSWSVFHGMPNVTDVFVNYYDPQSGWQGFVAPSRDIASVTSPAMRLAVDDGGNALGVWGERTSPPGGPSSFFATTYDAANGAWSATEEMESDNIGAADAADIASGPGGTFWVLFGLNKGTTMEVHANRFTPGSGWSGPMVLDDAEWDPADAFLSSLHIAVDADGNAMAAWSRYTDTDTNGTIDRTQDNESVFARRYDAAAGTWSAAQRLNATEINDALAADVLVDPSGGFLVLWYQNDASFERAGYGTFYRAGWEAAETLWDHADNLFPTGAAIDANGNALVIASSDDDNVFAVDYAAGSGWQPVATIENDPAVQSFPEALAMNARGEAFVLWRQGPSSMKDAYVRRFDPVSRTWSAAENIDAPETGDVRNGARIVIDAAGNAIAAWHADDTIELSAFAARYIAGTGWGAAAPLETSGDNTNSIAMGLGVDARGNAIAAWAQGAVDDQDVYFNRFE